MVVIFANTKGDKDDCPLYDTELTGEDFQRFRPCTFWELCGSTCMATDGCEFWTWDPTGDGKCNMKHEKGIAKESTGEISGSKGCFEL